MRGRYGYANDLYGQKVFVYVVAFHVVISVGWLMRVRGGPRLNFPTEITALGKKRGQDSMKWSRSLCFSVVVTALVAAHIPGMEVVIVRALGFICLLYGIIELLYQFVGNFRSKFRQVRRKTESD